MRRSRSRACYVMAVRLLRNGSAVAHCRSADEKRLAHIVELRFVARPRGRGGAKFATSDRESGPHSHESPMPRHFEVRCTYKGTKRPNAFEGLRRLSRTMWTRESYFDISGRRTP